MTVDVNGNESLPSSGFVVIPEDVSVIKINSRQLQLPMFWNLTSFVHGDKVQQKLRTMVCGADRDKIFF